MQVTYKVSGLSVPSRTQEFRWNSSGVGRLIGLLEKMIDCGVRYRESGLEAGVSIAFEYGDMDNWYEVRVTGSNEEMAHLIRLVNMFTQIMNDSSDARKMESEQVFRAICTWIMRRRGGVADGSFTLHDNLHYSWDMLHFTLCQVLKGEVPFPM